MPQIHVYILISFNHTIIIIVFRYTPQKRLVGHVWVLANLERGFRYQYWKKKKKKFFWLADIFKKAHLYLHVEQHLMHASVCLPFKRSRTCSWGSPCWFLRSAVSHQSKHGEVWIGCLKETELYVPMPMVIIVRLGVLYYSILTSKSSGPFLVHLVLCQRFTGRAVTIYSKLAEKCGR